MLKSRAKGDDLTVEFSITSKSSPQDLTGATLEGGAMSQDGSKVPATTQVTEAAAGKARMYFTPDSLAAGKWYLHFRVTLSTGETQSWQDEVNFTPSYL